MSLKKAINLGKQILKETRVISTNLRNQRRHEGDYYKRKDLEERESLLPIYAISQYFHELKKR